MMYDLTKDTDLEQTCQEETKEHKIKLITQDIIIGRQGAAISVHEWFWEEVV